MKSRMRTDEFIRGTVERHFSSGHDAVYEGPLLFESGRLLFAETPKDSARHMLYEQRVLSIAREALARMGAVGGDETA